MADHLALCYYTRRIRRELVRGSYPREGDFSLKWIASGWPTIRELSGCAGLSAGRATFTPGNAMRGSKVAQLILIIRPVWFVP